MPSPRNEHEGVQQEPVSLDSLWGSSVKVGAVQRILARPLRKGDTHISRSVMRAILTNDTNDAMNARGKLYVPVARTQSQDVCDEAKQICICMYVYIYIYIYIYI